jgi:hypothetical protein
MRYIDEARTIQQGFVMNCPAITVAAKYHPGIYDNHPNNGLEKVRIVE